MKVLIFSTQFTEIGGIERLAVELAVELNKQGIHADLLSMYSEDLPNVAEKKNELLAKGIPNVFFLGLKVNPSPASVIKGCFLLNQLVRKNNYDIVETSALSPIVIASWGLKWSKCRHLAGIHQVFLKDRDHSIQHKILKWSVSFNKRNRYYAISRYALKKWITYSNSQEKSAQCIYNSIPDDCFTASINKDYLRKQFCLPEQSTVIIYVGRVIQPKRPDLIIDALSDLCEEKNLAILFLGRVDPSVIGTAEMVENMKRTIHEKKLNHRIKFLGTTAEVPKIMASADLMVHPTQIEAFGLVLVEAMASGLQLVSTNVEGIPEVLEGTNNIMVEPNSATLLQNAILETLNRTTSESSMAILKGRKRAESFRTKERTKQMIKVFDAIISGRF